MKTKNIAANAMLAAMCAVLGYIAVETNEFKITFETFPIYMAALLFGPADAVAVGLVGTFIYQLLKYGISATTLLWMLPYAVCALIAGTFAKKYEFNLSAKQIMALTVLCELTITLLNTGVIYIDSNIYGYYTPALILGSLALRLAICIAKGIAFGAVLPKLLTILRKRQM